MLQLSRGPSPLREPPVLPLALPPRARLVQNPSLLGAASDLQDLSALQEPFSCDTPRIVSGFDGLFASIHFFSFIALTLFNTYYTCPSKYFITTYSLRLLPFHL